MLPDNYHFAETHDSKVFSSEEYSYLFNKNNGRFVRWGRSLSDDPTHSPIGPEILDIEVTTICNGVKNKHGVEAPCKFCYKSNTRTGVNMSFDTFVQILDKFPKYINPITGQTSYFLTQIAIGADSHATSNPDLWRMMDHARSLGIIPNITVADIDDEVADKIAARCGACAVSRYENKDLCYDSVKRLTDRGITQVNIHIMVSAETERFVWETMRDIKEDQRLQKLNAMVLLSLKPQGRGIKYTRLTQDKFKAIVDFALSNEIRIGFDSCGCNKFLQAVKDSPNYEQYLACSEPCESFGLFSAYVDVHGDYYPCSFTPGNGNWRKGISVLAQSNFMDIWNSDKLNQDRLISIKTVDDLGCRKCLLFDI